jgi:DNA-binding transcriptional LysR family regulator
VLNRRFAIAGVGLTLAFKVNVRDAIDRGELVSVLEKYCAPFPGYYLYYPQRRQASRALRAFIDHLQKWRRESRTRRR